MIFPNKWLCLSRVSKNIIMLLSVTKGWKEEQYLIYIISALEMPKNYCFIYRLCKKKL